MRSESTNQPTHTHTGSLFDQSHATLPTTDPLGRAAPLRQVSRRQDHRDLGTRGERFAQRRYTHGGLNFFVLPLDDYDLVRRHERARAVSDFLPDSPWAGPCQTDWTRGSPPA